MRRLMNNIDPKVLSVITVCWHDPEKKSFGYWLTWQNSSRKF